MKKEFKEFFDEDGDLLDEVYKYVLDNGAEGDLAKAFLASEFASETHGNYVAETLYSRSSISGDIKLTPNKEEK